MRFVAQCSMSGSLLYAFADCFGETSGRQSGRNRLTADFFTVPEAEWPQDEPELRLLPPRSTAGQLTLDQHIGVRIPGGQPKNSAVLAALLQRQFLPTIHSGRPPATNRKRLPKRFRRPLHSTPQKTQSNRNGPDARLERIKKVNPLAVKARSSETRNSQSFQPTHIQR